MRLFGPRVNADGQRHADVYVPPARDEIDLRFADGTPTGFTLSADRLAYRDGRGQDGCVRLDFHERLGSDAGDLAFARGGNGFVDAQDIKYGHVAVADLAADPGRPSSSGGGRGDAAKVDESAGSYAVVVESIPPALHYKRPQDTRMGSNAGARWLHYGDPGSDQGDRHDVHYSYLLWSFLNAHGGGHVRALLAPNQVVQPCDVDPILMDAWDSDGNVDGDVLARYVRTEEGGTPLYGWMVWEHRSGDDPVVEHARLLSGPPVTTPPGLAVAPPVSSTAPSEHGPTAATSHAAAAAAATPPPPPPPPPPAPALVPLRAVVDLAQAVVSRRGTVRVPIDCAGNAATACTGALRLDAALPAAKRSGTAAARYATLARRRFRVAAGTQAAVTLRVRSRLRARLPRGHRVRARVVVGSVARAVTLVRR
jgi:hypothetical protein